MQQPHRVTSVHSGLGDDPRFVHMPEQIRGEMGEWAATYIYRLFQEYGNAAEGHDFDPTLPPCPGCFMAVTLNALLAMCERTGISYEFMANTMTRALLDVKRNTTPSNRRHCHAD